MHCLIMSNNFASVYISPTKEPTPFSNALKKTAALWWEPNWGRSEKIYTHISDKKWTEKPVSPLKPNLGRNSRQFCLEDRESTGKLCRPVVGLGWMCLKRDHRVENWGGQVEQCSLMCKGRIRHWVDPTGSLELRVCCLCVEEPINQLHTNIFS